LKKRQWTSLLVFRTPPFVKKANTLGTLETAFEEKGKATHANLCEKGVEEGWEATPWSLWKKGITSNSCMSKHGWI